MTLEDEFWEEVEREHALEDLDCERRDRENQYAGHPYDTALAIEAVEFERAA